MRLADGNHGTAGQRDLSVLNPADMGNVDQIALVTADKARAELFL